MPSLKKLVIGIIALLVIFSLFASSKSELEKEYQWYTENGYSPFNLDYADVLDTLPVPITVNEIEVSKQTLRVKAANAKNIFGGQCYISLCPDIKAIIVIGNFDSDTEIATIYYWKPRARNRHFETQKPPH